MEIIIIAILYFGYHIIKETNDDIQMRNLARSKGWNTYPSRTGIRCTDTNEKYYGSKRYYEEHKDLYNATRK